MRLDARLESLLKKHEGLRLTPYTDTTGHLTIGYGRNLADVGISQEEAGLMLHNDIQRTASDLERACPWITSLDVVRAMVLVNMAFNLGVPGLMAFKQTLAEVQAGRWESAARAMLSSKWADQVGQRAKDLAQMMQTGKWPMWLQS